VQERVQHQFRGVTGGQPAGLNRLSRGVDEGVKGLQQPPVRRGGGQDAALLGLPEHGQAAVLHRGLAGPDLVVMVEGRGPPQEGQLRPVRDHRGDQVAQAVVIDVL